MISREKLASEAPMSLEDRRAFLQLPLAERRRRLAQQAEETLALYEQESAQQERIEWQGGDIIEC